MPEFYGQFNTDEYITRYFNRTGVAIDVGAAHPDTGSNTYHLEKHGWKVLCIEPNPALIPALESKRKHVLNVAVGTSDVNNKDFHIVTLINGDQTALSSLTLDPILMKQHEHLIKDIKTIKVNVRRLDTIIEEWDEPDLISIDTEGTEIGVMIGLENHRPSLIVMENNHALEEYRHFMRMRGYKLDQRIVVNDFYIPLKEDKDVINHNTMQPSSESTTDESIFGLKLADTVDHSS